MTRKFCVLIPAYNPDKKLITLIESLTSSLIEKIIVVNDGSLKCCDILFDNIKQHDHVTLLTHKKNLGKGAALRTGLKYIHKHYPELVGVVTADADGQHIPKDIIKIGNSLITHPENLILGARDFSHKIPLRSKIGNLITEKLFKIVVGQKISDTQSGLRGIPFDLIPELLKIKSNGYEFELDMLLKCKYTQRFITEEKIETKYIDANKSSHFNPVFDSLKIYFELFRFMLLSIATAIVDYSVFFILNAFGFHIYVCQIFARVVSVIFSYPLVRKVVFMSKKQHRIAFPKYVGLVITSGVISYILIKVCIANFGLNVIEAKMLAELMTYIFNFLVQRDIIFVHKVIRKKQFMPVISSLDK